MLVSQAAEAMPNNLVDDVLGIGGDYPLSSIITSEFATTKWRGAMMGAVFAMQGLGQLCAAIVMICVTAGFKQSLLSAKTYATCQGECAVAVDKVSQVPCSPLPLLRGSVRRSTI